MPDSVVEVSDDLVCSDVGFRHILNAGGIFPNAPSQPTEVGMLNHSFIMYLRPVLSLGCLNRLPVEPA